MSIERLNRRRGPRVGLFLVLALLRVPAFGDDFMLQGTVSDPSGALIPAAKIVAYSTQGSVVGNSVTSPTGDFKISGVTQGSYLLRVSAAGFQEKEVQVSAGRQEPVKVVLDLAVSPTEITVTSTLGAVEEVAKAPQVVTVRDREYLLQRPLPTIGNGLENAPGVLVQQTTYGQVSPVLRGLTGFETLLLVDGVRYNTSIFRSGPNQYLAFVDPSQARGIEAVLGPASSQYGSDALGGTINVRSVESRFGGSRRPEFHGEANLFAASADMSAGANFLGSLGNDKVNWLFGGYGRKMNDLRGGDGRDSHHSFYRFLGVSPAEVRDRIFGSRMQDTGFSQFGFDNKLAFRLPKDQSLTLRQIYSDQQNVRSYRDQLGGVGRLQALVEPQRLNFGYARYEKLGLGFLDSLSGTFSVNSMIDGYIRQNLRPTDVIQRDNARIDVLGYGVQALTHIGRNNFLAFGGDTYREKVFSTRYTTNPVTSAVTQSRALYPNGSKYATSGLFAQDSWDLIPNRLRMVAGGRLTFVGFETFAKDNIADNGASLGVTDSSQNYTSFSFNTSLTYNITRNWAVNGLVGRGIRAPNINDLGSIGLTSLGFDVTSIDAAKVGAKVGTDGSEAALATKQDYTTLKAENLMDYEFGVRFDSDRFYGRVQFFNSLITDPLVGRTLVFPVGNVPGSVAGYNVTPLPQSTAQKAQGVVTVATSLAPRAIRSVTNAGKITYYGTEAVYRYKVTSRWTVEGNYSFLVGRELEPNRPIRRLPPQQWYTALRYTPTRRLWLELCSTFSGSQFKMNNGDYDDDRMGASRRRTDIRDFFRGGFASPYITPGADGRLGTADDLFSVTGETLLQIQDRTLPIGKVVNGVLIVNDSTRVPLYLGTSSFWVFGVRGGFSLTERVSLNYSLMNLTDRNYRIHGSGTDSPGINGSLGVRYFF